MDSTPSFNAIQQKAIDLMRSDLRFIYTMIVNIEQLKSNYTVSTLPYIGLVIDGIEDWINRYNNSNQLKLNLPVFSKEEQKYYEEMRGSIKIWERPYDEIFNKMKALYDISDAHFSSLCKPIAKKLKLYDIFGVDLVDGELCGNTILCAYYSPDFSFDEEYGEHIKEMAMIGGHYIRLFNATTAFSVKKEMTFETRDYGGLCKSPFGKEFNDSFILFSALCQIQYLLLCVEQYIDEECPTKLRFEYVLYYYLNAVIPCINKRLNTTFAMDSKYHSDLFRNAMAHYGLGVALKPDELIEDDPFGGLTQKFFQCDYYALKQDIISQLCGLAQQIKDFLNINQ